MTSLLTAGECALLLKVSTPTFRRLVTKHRIPCVRVNARVIRFDRRELEKFLNTELKK